MTTDIYLPPHVTQRTGSHCEFSNCAPAVGAWLQRGVSGGTSTPTPEEFRIKAGGGSGSTSPSTGCKTFFEVDLVKGLHASSFDATLMEIPFGSLRDRVGTPRRALFAVATDYEFWPKALDCMHGTVGPDVDHMVGIVPGLHDGKVTVMNPLCTEYQDIALAALETAATRFARNHGRTEVQLVRIFRPIPVGLDANASELSDLRERLASRDDYIAGIRSSIIALLHQESPK